jgi:hypothetical protein
MNIIYNEQKKQSFCNTSNPANEIFINGSKNNKTKTFLQIFKWDNSTFESSTYYPIIPCINIQLCIFSPTVTCPLSVITVLGSFDVV